MITKLGLKLASSHIPQLQHINNKTLCSLVANQKGNQRTNTSAKLEKKFEHSTNY